MADMIFWAVILGISLFTLIKAADYFIEAAEKLGYYAGLSCFVIGVTIVAVGTSLPELVSSIFAVIKDSSEIVTGNVVGSNIANIFLILGFTALFFKTLNINSKAMVIDIIVLILASVLLLVTGYNNVFTALEGLVFLVLVSAYVIYLARNPSDIAPSDCQCEKEVKLPREIIILLLSCFFIYLGSDWTVNSIVKLSEVLNIAKEFIAISVVAFGTSLPELIVSLSAIKKGNSDMVIGNIMGSSTFNILGIMGVASLFGEITVSDNILRLGLPFMFFAVAVFVTNCFFRKISRLSGVLYILFYVYFILISIKGAA